MKNILTLLLLFNTRVLLCAEPQVRTILKSKELVKQVEAYFDQLKKHLIENIDQQIIIGQNHSTQNHQKKQLLEKEFRRLLGKRSNSQNKIDLPVENLGVFQDFIDKLHKNSTEPSQEQLDFIKNLNLAFQAAYNSTTREEMQLPQSLQDQNKILRACQSCLTAITQYSPQLLKKTKSSQLVISAEFLVHARQRQESPEKKANSPRDANQHRSPRASPVRHRSGTVSVIKNPL